MSKANSLNFRERVAAQVDAGQSPLEPQFRRQADGAGG
jgi:hypothetical protein